MKKSTKQRRKQTRRWGRPFRPSRVCLNCERGVHEHGLAPVDCMCRNPQHGEDGRP